MADNLLDKASILLTPTAYNDGSMLSVKPEIAFGEELSTNGDFSNGTTGWSNGSSTLSVVDGKLKILATGAFSYARQNITVVSGKKYKITVNFFYNSLVGNIEVYDGTTNTISEQLSKDGVITLSITPSSTNLRLTLLNRNGVSGDFNYWDNVSVKEDLSGDFTFSRSSAATRVNAQGLVENVQIISSELVSNGNFSQIGTEEVSNGNFSQEGSELVTNGDFATDSDWSLGTGWSIEDGVAKVDNTNNNYISQDGIVSDTKTYAITFTILNYISGSIRLRLGNTYGDYVSGNGTYTKYIQCTTSNKFRVYSSPSGANLSIDNVSVKEVGQDWTLGTGITISENQANFTGNANSFLTQSGVVTLNKTYKATFTVSNYVSGAIDINLGGSTRQGNISANGTYTFYIPVPSGNILYFQEDFSNGFTGSITNISVKEVGQDWTLGTGWSIGDDKASCDGSQSSQSNLYQAGIVPINNTYKVTFDIVVTSGSVYLSIGGSNAQPTVSSSGTYTFTSKATTGDSNLYFSTNSTFIGSVTNISVKEITDDTDLPRINYEGFSYQDSLGSEEIVNGDFSVDSNWNKGTGITISNDVALFTSVSSGLQLSQSGTEGVAGKTYKITYEIKSISQGAFSASIGTTLSNNQNNQVGVYTEYLTATGTGIFYIRSRGTTTGSIDNISVKEVLGQEVVPDSGCGSWLLEPQSTNLIPYSSDLSAWSKLNSTITESSVLSLDGVNNSYGYERTSSSSSYIYRVVSLANTTQYTLSFFTKSGTSTNIRTDIWDTTQSTQCSIDVDLVTKAVSNFVGTSYKIEDYTNGWMRISVTFTSESSFGTTFNRYFNYDSVGTELYIWGAQLEQQSYATSYIPTNGAASTRNQDIATNSGNSTLINSTEGVLYAEIAANNLPTFKHISLSDSSSANRLNLFIYNSVITVNFEVGGVRQSSLSYTIPNVSDFNKVAFSYKLNQFKLFVNGLQKAIDTLGLVPSINTFNSLSFNNSTASNFYGKNKALAVYKEALTDANLRSLTYPNPVATTFDLDFDTIAEQFTFTRGSEATFVNAQGLIESTASNDAPRIDYSTGAKAFLLENQSTNIINYSEDFSQSYWTKSNTLITSNSVISPDGTLNADKLTEDNASSEKLMFKSGISTLGTISVFAKKLDDNNRLFQIRRDGGDNSWSWFNLEDGIISSQVNGIASIENYSNGWYRCSFTPTNSNGTVVFGISNGGTSRSVSYQGNGTSGVYIFGAMLENQSYSTSYIPTSGASATRNQELCNNATPVINSEEGTLYAEISALADEGHQYISLSDGSTSNRVTIELYPAPNIIVTRLTSNNVQQSFLVADNINKKNYNKIAIKYKENYCSFWMNGVEISTDTSVVTPIGLSELSFDDGNNNSPFFGNTKGLKVYPKALADVQLQDLTTI